jgi:hypothetical protein
MPVSQNDLDWFAARLLVAVYDTNAEHRMSVQVQALAEVVRNAKLAIATAQTAAVRMSNSASRVVDRVAEVEGMIKALDDAEQELGQALGTVVSNGAPAGPLPDTLTLPSVSPAASIDASIVQVQNANGQAA